MGYEPEDLPGGAADRAGPDSLMAVRIKNRVEYDFDLPPIQLQAVRDANLYAVEKLIHYAIEHRDEVDPLPSSRRPQTAEEIAAAQAELMGGERPSAELEQRLAEAGQAGEQGCEVIPDAPLDIPPPPTGCCAGRPPTENCRPGPSRPRRPTRRGPTPPATPHWRGRRGGAQPAGVAEARTPMCAASATRPSGSPSPPGRS